MTWVFWNNFSGGLPARDQLSLTLGKAFWDHIQTATVSTKFKNLTDLFYFYFGL